MPFKDLEVRRNRQREYQGRYNHSKKGKECHRHYDLKRAKDPKRIEWAKNYQHKYRQRPYAKERKLQYDRRLRQIWRNGAQLEWGMGTKTNQEIVRESELFAQNIALPTLDFSNITKTFKMFTFDFICDLDGQVCLVDVTLCRQRSLHKKNKIASRLGLPFYVLFIRPDKSFYYLKQVNFAYKNIKVPDNVIRKLERGKFQCQSAKKTV